MASIAPADLRRPSTGRRGCRPNVASDVALVIGSAGLGQSGRVDGRGRVLRRFDGVGARAGRAVDGCDGAAAPGETVETVGERGERRRSNFSSPSMHASERCAEFAVISPSAQRHRGRPVLFLASVSSRWHPRPEAVELELAWRRRASAAPRRRVGRRGPGKAPAAFSPARRVSVDTRRTKASTASVGAFWFVGSTARSTGGHAASADQPWARLDRRPPRWSEVGRAPGVRLGAAVTASEARAGRAAGQNMRSFGQWAGSPFRRSERSSKAHRATPRLRGSAPLPPLRPRPVDR